MIDEQVEEKGKRIEFVFLIMCFLPSWLTISSYDQNSFAMIFTYVVSSLRMISEKTIINKSSIFDTIIGILLIALDKFCSSIVARLILKCNMQVRCSCICFMSEI